MQVQKSCQPPRKSQEGDTMQISPLQTTGQGFIFKKFIFSQKKSEYETCWEKDLLHFVSVGGMVNEPERNAGYGAQSSSNSATPSPISPHHPLALSTSSTSKSSRFCSISTSARLLNRTASICAILTSNNRFGGGCWTSDKILNK